MSPVHRRARSGTAVLGALTGLSLTVGCAPTSPVPQAAPAPTSAAEDTGWQEQLVSGPPNPEDLILLETGTAVISGMSADPGGGAGAAGSLYAMDPQTGVFVDIWPAAGHDTAPDETRYPACPGPPDLDAASPHGLGLEVDDQGTTRLHVVNHGGREAVEIFEVEDTADGAHLTWVGCSELPQGSFGNGVVPDPVGDGFYVTHFLDPADMVTGFEQAFAGQPTGHVLHWAPDTGWTKVPGSEMSTPNGVAVSADGRSLYVASWGGRELVELDVETGQRLATTGLEIMPDNLRPADDGTLLVTGQAIDSIETFFQYQEGERSPEARYDVYALDPEDFTVDQIAHGEPDGFGNPTTALETPQGILLGSVTGESLLRLTRD